MHKNITLLLTLFKPKIEEINYWENVYFSLKEKDVHFHILIDNPDFDLSLLKNFDKSDIYQNKLNKGKLRTIVDHIKNHNVKTSHFKSVDPDDYFFTDGFLRMKETLTKGMIKMKGIIINEDLENYDFLTNINLENESLIQKYLKKSKSFATSVMILPTEYIYKDTNFNNQNIINLAEDQLLATICMVNGAELIEVEDYWYIYIFRKGITNNLNFNHEKNMDEMWESVKIWKELLSNTKISYKSHWPKNFLLSFIKNINSEERRKEIIELSNFEKDIKRFSTSITVFSLIENLDKETLNTILKYKLDSKNQIIILYKSVGCDLTAIDKKFESDFIFVDEFYLEILNFIKLKKIKYSHFKIVDGFVKETMQKYEEKFFPIKQCIVNQKPISNNYQFGLKEFSLYSTDKVFQTIEFISKIELDKMKIYGDVIFGICSLNADTDANLLSIDIEPENNYNLTMKNNEEFAKEILNCDLVSKRDNYFERMKILELEETINFVSFLDKNIIELFEMMFNSMKNTYMSFNWYVGVTKEVETKIKKIIGNDKRVIVRIVDDAIKHLDDTALFGNITLLTYCRFFIKEIFFDVNFEEKKFVYLDTDILIQCKIPEEYIKSNDNIAVTNISRGGSMQSINFWTGFFKRRQTTVGNEIDKYKLVSEKILSKIPNFEVFNAGVIIVNSPKKYFSLIEKIKKDEQKIMHLFDDQSLLNYYNNGEIRVKDDTRINFKIRKDFNFSKETSLVHFLGPNKYLMKRIHDDDFNYELIFRDNLLRYNVGIIVIKNKEDTLFIKDKIGEADIFVFNKISDKIVPIILPNIIEDVYFENVNEIVEKIVNNKFVLIMNAADFNKFDLEMLDKINFTTKNMPIPFNFSSKEKWEKEINDNSKILLPTNTEGIEIFWNENIEKNIKTINENNLELHLVELNSKGKIDEK